MLEQLKGRTMYVFGLTGLGFKSLIAWLCCFWAGCDRATGHGVMGKQRRIDKGSLRCIFPGQAPGDLTLQLSPAVGDGLSCPLLPIRSSLGTHPLVRSEPSWSSHSPKLSSECCYPGSLVSTREPFRKHFISKPQE